MKVILVFSILSTSLYSNILIPNNQCALIVASDTDYYKAAEYAETKVENKQYLNIYSTTNGRYAVSIGFLKNYESKNIISKWKENGKIPQDSFCAKADILENEINMLSKPMYTNNSSTYTFEKNKKDCDSGNFGACSDLGSMYIKGRDVSRDYFKAEELFTKSCDGGNPTGCGNLGVMYINALGVKQNNYKARELFEKACTGGDSQGCYSLGLMYFKGLSLKQDYFKAKELYRKACDGGSGGGCYNLGSMYSKGLGLRQNDVKAKKLYGKACDMGISDGCYNYAILNKK